MPHSVKKRANTKLARDEIPELTFESPTPARRRTSVYESTGRQQTGKESGKRIRGESDDSTLHLDNPRKAVEKAAVSVWIEQGSPTVSLEIEEELENLIVDNGSNMSILQPGVLKSDVRGTAVNPYGVTGETLDKQGQQRVFFVLAGRKFSHTFLVCPLPTKADGLLGADFLDKVGAEINFDKGKLSLLDNNETPYACGIVSTKHASLTVFPKDKRESD